MHSRAGLATTSTPISSANRSAPACIRGSASSDAGRAKSIAESPTLRRIDVFKAQLHFVREHAKWNRDWMKSLPADLADKIAYKNAEALARWALSDK